MIKEEGNLSSLEKLAHATMRQVSRRGFLKGAGAVGLALVGNLFGMKYVLAYIKCPNPADGVCDNCYSTCITGGWGQDCYCPSCDCTPPYEIAICRWANNGPNACIFIGDCFGCTP